MKRWNGWGDETITHTVDEHSLAFLGELVGETKPPVDATFEAIVSQVPLSRLPTHALVSIDAADRVRHARGQSLPDWVALRSGDIGTFPDGVAYPTTSAEVQTLLQYATAAGVRLIPYGGGSSVVGHINPQPGDAPVLTLDLSHLNQLTHFSVKNHLATFGAGVSGPDLEAHLRAQGFTLGHFPQSFEYSTLGGWIATRSSGQQSLGYGRIEHLFAGGQVETPLGMLEFPPFPASAAGPNLKEIVLGSEGRLGIITEATVQIAKLPETEEFHTIFFPNWEQASNAAQEIVQAGLPLSLLRLSSAIETETMLKLAGHPWLIGAMEKLLSIRKVGDEKCMLLFGASGSHDLVKMVRKGVVGIASGYDGLHIGQKFGQEWHKTRFRSPYLRNALWEKGYAVDTLETATNWENVDSLMVGIDNALHNALHDLDEQVHAFTHLSHLYPHGSSIYTTYIFRLAADPAETLARWQRLKGAASEAIVAHKGTISHQHGVGLDHAPYLVAEKGDLGIRTIEHLCHLFDPKGLLNPGKLV